MGLIIFHKMSPKTKSLLNSGEETMEPRLVLRCLSLFPSPTSPLPSPPLPLVSLSVVTNIVSYSQIKTEAVRLINVTPNLDSRV